MIIDEDGATSKGVLRLLHSQVDNGSRNVTSFDVEHKDTVLRIVCEQGFKSEAKKRSP